MAFFTFEKDASSKHRPARRNAHGLRFFCRDESGSTAVSFAFIAPVFLACIGLFLMLGYLFIVATTLEDGVREAGRRIRIGEASAVGLSRAQFRTFVCSHVAMEQSRCVSSLVVDVDSAASIAALPDNMPMTDGQLDDNASSYNPGSTSDFVIVKAFLPYYSLNGLFSLLGAENMDRFTLNSTTVFRNEPF